MNEWHDDLPTKYETLRTLIMSFIIKSFKRPGVAKEQTSINQHDQFAYVYYMYSSLTNNNL